MTRAAANQRGAAKTWTREARGKARGSSDCVDHAFKKNLPDGEIFHFLPKPFSLKQLAVAVKETLGR